MLERLESDYDCANAGDDLHRLLQQSEQLQARQNLSSKEQELLNRIDNQIHFIRNKCSIPGS